MGLRRFAAVWEIGESRVSATDVSCFGLLR
jgi:hypothetical protein